MKGNGDRNNWLTLYVEYPVKEGHLDRKIIQQYFNKKSVIIFLMILAYSDTTRQVDVTKVARSKTIKKVLNVIRI